MLEDFLPLVTKPARYINNEINVVRKDSASVQTRVCLFFPDTYEVGMSHLGLRILYDILNNRPDTACERVFSPWVDYEQRLRASGRPLTSLETNLPLNKFDIIGITLQYELSYTNILNGLDLAGLPLRSRDRDDSHPLIIAGGPCAVNPEPLADFIDVFFIGEAEEAVHELVELRQAQGTRSQLLAALANREGFYVPSLGGTPVRRRFLKDIESAPYPDKPILPLMKPVHDRVSVEVARGCIRGCRFCQAGIIYRPYRERGTDRIKDVLQKSLQCTGYEELSLASLSTGDHSDIEPLVIELMHTYQTSRISVSLPSLRVGTLTPEMIKAIAGTRKTGFTLAPEAGTEHLRRVINKPVSDLDLRDTAETIFRSGWSVLKLYFMIGLPTETDEDLDGIVRLALDLFAVGKNASKRHIQINVSVSTFVPKPHTPFQWMGQASLAEIRRKQEYLNTRLRRRGIALKLHDPETSQLEGAFARGDRGLGRVIEEAFRLGCRFDSWTECFDFNKWTAAFSACGLDMSAAATHAFALDEELPWSHIRSGVTREFLMREYQKAVAEEVTDNCREECTHCGIGCRDGGTPSLGRPAATGTEAGRLKQSLPSGEAPHAGPPDQTIRIRLKYTKTGRIRFLSHLDFMTMFHRAVVRAGIPVTFSRGFNPHPKFAFGPALSVGLESEAEYLDMEITPPVDMAEIAESLNKVLPDGVVVVDALAVSKQAPSLSGSISRYVYEVQVPAGFAEGVQQRLEEFMSREMVMVAKDGVETDIKPGIEAITVAAGKDVPTLLITIVDKDRCKPRIQDTVALLFRMDREHAAIVRIKRVGSFCRNKDQWINPLEL